LYIGCSKFPGTEKQRDEYQLVEMVCHSFVNSRRAKAFRTGPGCDCGNFLVGGLREATIPLRQPGATSKAIRSFVFV
jgi:hypothetical protein